MRGGERERERWRIGIKRERESGGKMEVEIMIEEGGKEREKDRMVGREVGGVVERERGAFLFIFNK